MLNLLDTTTTNQGSTWFSYAIIGVMIVALVVMFFLSSKRRKKQEDETKKIIDAVKPGNKVKTIGGICGIVVEVNAEENTFVLETGTETSGKCFIKFDRQAIYQTDAVAEKEDVKEQDETSEVKETPEVEDKAEIKENSESSENETVSKKSKKN